EIAVDIDKIGLLELPGTGLDIGVPDVPKPGKGLDLREGRRHPGSDRDIDHGVVGLRGAGDAQVHAVDVVRPVSIAVIRALVPDPGGDEQAGGESYGKPEDVNGRKDGVPPE